MSSTTRKKFPIGGSTGITIPQEMTDPNVEEVTMAANDRLLIVDGKGEIPPDKLQEFFWKYVESNFNSWWEKEKEHAFEKQVYIPNSVWKKFSEVSARSKGKRESYAKHNQDNLIVALLKWAEEEDKRLTELGV